jgi:tRNA-specific 2-thiouridylase
MDADDVSEPERVERQVELLERRSRVGMAATWVAVVDEDGRELGRHAGFWQFTPGQRRGLAVAARVPLYTLRTDAATNTVVVGPRPALGVETFEARGRLYVPVKRADVKWRYRSAAVAARVTAREGGFRVELDEPAGGVAAGQAAVLYEGDVIVGAGLISAGTGT